MLKTCLKYLMGLALMIFTTGCLLRAHYRRPEVDIPLDWRVSTKEASGIANIDWWKQFQDPVLDNLISMAIESNNDLGVAVGRVFEFAARLGVAESFLFPEINGTALAKRRERSLNNGRKSNGSNQQGNNNNNKRNNARGRNNNRNRHQPKRIRDIFSTLLHLTYYVDIWGKIHNEVDASLADLLSQIEARRSVVLTVVSQVASTYVILRQYDKQLEIAIQTYNSREASFELFKLRYEGGLISEMEVKQAEAEALSALVEVKQLQVLIPQTENQLSVLIGMNPGKIARGLLLENFQLPPEVPVNLPSDLLEQRPDILQAEQTLIATNSRVAEAKANFFPQINLTGSYGYQSSSLSDLFSSSTRTWQYGADLMQQIFNAGRIGYEVEIEEALRMQALYNYYLTIQKAFKEVNDALIAHEISIELVKIGQKEVKVLADYLYLANLQYENGQTDYLIVLDAERRLFAAQLQLVQFQADAINSLIALYAALGGGWVVDADDEVVRAMPDLHELRCFDVEK